MTRLARLRSYIREGAALPFVWGQSDCCPWALGWVEREIGSDPFATVRGAYASRMACARLLAQHGGLEALARRLMSTAGLRETDAAKPGDVALVQTAIGPMGAICVGGAFAMKSIDGVVVMPSNPIVAWSI